MVRQLLDLLGRIDIVALTLCTGCANLKVSATSPNISAAKHERRGIGSGEIGRAWEGQFMKKMVRKILVLGLLMGIGPIPVKTQASIRLTDSGRAMRTFPGHTGASLKMLALLGDLKGVPALPAPVSMIVFGSGLMLLGGLLRRRKAAPDQARQDPARTVTPLFAN
jgi:hypothetical protein